MELDNIVHILAHMELVNLHYSIDRVCSIEPASNGGLQVKGRRPIGYDVRVPLDGFKSFCFIRPCDCKPYGDRVLSLNIFSSGLATVCFNK